MLPIADTVPSRNPPVMMWLLIAANVAVFLIEASLEPPQLRELFHRFGVVPARYGRPGEWSGIGLAELWPLVTSQFLHGGGFHCFINMWTLWIFGDNVEDRMGPGRFLAFYLCCGVIAALVHVWSMPDSPIPSVGASGAIAGVLGAYLVSFPAARVVVLVPVFFLPLFFDVPAVFYIGLWFLGQLYSGALSLLAEAEVGGVAWWAHIGGFGAGLLLLWPFLIGGPRARRDHDDGWIDPAWGRHSRARRRR